MYSSEQKTCKPKVPQVSFTHEVEVVSQSNSDMLHSYYLSLIILPHSLYFILYDGDNMS